MPRNPTAAQKAALDAFAKEWPPKIQKAFWDAVYRARARIDVDALTDALARGDVLGASEMLRLNANDFSSLREAMRGAYISAGEGMNGMLPQQIAAQWGFEGYNPRALTWIEQRGAALVQGITEDSQAATQRAILDVLERPQERSLRSAALDITGRMNRATARREGGILGLTAEQTQWAINARADLANLDARYFNRARRDKRFDKTVAAAIRNGRPLSQAQIDKITGRYKDKLLDMRGQIIARNEAFEAQASARHEAMRQVRERPDVEAVTKRWQLGFPVQHRDNHVALAGRKVADLEDRFDLGGGLTALHPHDADLPAGETINCRCSLVYRVRLRRD